MSTPTRITLPVIDKTIPGLEPDPVHDAVSHPKHYTSSPAACRGCGRPIECIDVIEHMALSVGTAVKYLWRQGLKDDAIQDLEKARQYIEFEILRLQRMQRGGHEAQ
jgi:hypothetical protein